MPRVLIVDDHAFIRRGIQSILNSSPGWEFCGEAENGIAAARLQAVIDLGELGPRAEEAAPVLAKALRSSDEEMRLNAAIAPFLSPLASMELPSNASAAPDC